MRRWWQARVLLFTTLACENAGQSKVGLVYCKLEEVLPCSYQSLLGWWTRHRFLVAILRSCRPRCEPVTRTYQSNPGKRLIFQPYARHAPFAGQSWLKAEISLALEPRHVTFSPFPPDSALSYSLQCVPLPLQRHSLRLCTHRLQRISVLFSSRIHRRLARHPRRTPEPLCLTKRNRP